MSNALFQALPGISLRVKEVNAFLARMWSPGEEEGPSAEAHASQLNLIIHVGREVSENEGVKVFETAIAFSKHYPSRIIFLCPVENIEGPDSVMAKLFSLCYVSQESRHFCTAEAIILGFLPQDRIYLKDLIFLWAENDLPIYHWLHRIPADIIEKEGLPLLKGCRRVVFDTAIEDAGIQQIDWPKSQLIGDLARSAFLPLRQTLGQFLSAYSPQVLVQGLKLVELSICEKYKAYGAIMLNWQKTALEICSNHTETVSCIDYQMQTISEKLLKINWHYQNNYSFKAQFDFENSLLSLEANFGKGVIVLNQPLCLLSDEKILAEALFFSS